MKIPKRLGLGNLLAVDRLVSTMPPQIGKLVSSLAMVTVIVVGCVAAGSAHASTSATIVAGAQLTNVTLGLGTGIQSIDMLSPMLGYAIAANTPSNSKDPVLVQTTDGGRSWTVRSALFPGPFTQTYGGLITTLDFVNPRVGYVVGNLPNPGTVLMTVDAGLKWKRIVPPGKMAIVMIAHSTVVVVSTVCAPHQRDSNLCPNELTLFRVAATTSERSLVIPKLGRFAWHNAAPLAVLSPTTFVVTEGSSGGGGEAAVQSLLMTRDAGSTWHRIGDPCGSLGTEQLLVRSPGHWLLSCFLGEGMSQGMTRLWRTNNSGASWSIVSLNRDRGTTKGNIGNGGGEFMTLSFSGNDRILFGAVGGAVGGVVYSTDGGVNWKWTHVDGQGGANESLSTFGPTGAIDDVIGGLIYRTTNDTTWTVLPSLPAGIYKGTPTCTVGRHVAVHFNAKHVKGIPGDFPMVFTNNGAAACYLAGAPTVQPVSGPLHRPIGPVAEQDNAYSPVKAVFLKPHGGTASISLLMNPTLGYPKASACAGKSVTGFRVAFNSPATFYIPLVGVSERVCTSIASTMVNSAVAGTSGRSS